LAVVVFADVDAACCGEVGIESEGLTVQVADGCVADLTEVMGQDLRRESYGDTLCALGQ